MIDKEQIAKRLFTLRSEKGESQDALGSVVGVEKSGISSYEKGKSLPSPEKLVALADHYGVTVDYLLTGRVPGAPAPAISFATVQTAAGEKPLFMDHNGNTLAPIINYSAAANYLAGYETQEFFEHLDMISLPPMMVKGGRHMVFPVVGDSMANTFLAKDYVLCREVHPNDWKHINPLTVCVIVSKSRGIQLKRVKVRPQEQMIRCKSDNRMHHGFNLDWDDVLEIWRFEWRLTANAENVGEQLFTKVDNLEDEVTDLRLLIESIVDQKELQRLESLALKSKDH